jgi:hypothetical protein
MGSSAFMGGKKHRINTMSPAQWVALALLAIGVCWLAGVFVELSRDEPRRSKEQIDADVEELLRGEK